MELRVYVGQLVGLIGANGAGKTTFIDAITGFTAAERPHRAGRQTDIGRLAPHRRAALGPRADLAVDRALRRPQRAGEPDRRLRAADAASAALGPRPRPRHDDRRVDESLALLGLAPLGEELPTSLTLGQRKLVGVARALVAEPRLLCLDEPAAGLDANESRVLGARLRQLVDAAARPRC